MALMQLATEAPDTFWNVEVSFLLARLAIVTLRTDGVEPPVYIIRPAAYARCIRFRSPLLLAMCMCTQGDSIDFCKFYSDLLLPSRSQTLVTCTSFDSLRCVVYFYNRPKVICATNKHLERDKCWKVVFYYLISNIYHYLLSFFAKLLFFAR